MIASGFRARRDRAIEVQGHKCATHGCAGTPTKVARAPRGIDLAFCAACFDRRRGHLVPYGAWRDDGPRAAREARKAAAST